MSSRKANRQARKADRRASKAARKDTRQARKDTRRENRQERRMTRATRGDRRREARAERQGQRQAARAERGPWHQGLGDTLGGLAGQLLGGVGGGADPYDLTGDDFYDADGGYAVDRPAEQPWYAHPGVIVGGIAAAGVTIYALTR
jgi:glutamate synthase domain-containing protein 3